jgi:hypothetical protein
MRAICRVDYRTGAGITYACNNTVALQVKYSSTISAICQSNKNFKHLKTNFLSYRDTVIDIFSVVNKSAGLFW